MFLVGDLIYDFVSSAEIWTKAAIALNDTTSTFSLNG
jgi:hypothetical protein